MIIILTAVTDWVAHLGASTHTTSDAGNLTSVRPPHINDPSSIIVGTDPLSQLPQWVTRPFSVHSTFIIPLSHPILFKIFYLFAALLLTIYVLWSLTLLAFI
jgi:hypothetical protein